MIGQRQTGNETYVVGLLSGLAGQPGLRVAAAVDAEASIPRQLRHASIEWLTLRSRSNWLRLTWDLDDLCRRWQAHVLHSTYLAPFRCSCPSVVMVHDVSFRRFPELFSMRDRVLFSTLVPSGLRRAAAIVTDSEHAKREIATLFPGLAPPVTATPLGVDQQFGEGVTPAQRDDARRRYDDGEGFVLAVGSIQPRKNLASLIRAFGRIRIEHPRLNLVLVGPGFQKMPRLRSLVDSLDLIRQVHVTGYVTTDELRALYSTARLFVHPSVYEGFGLPILEAMACGAPVVAANTSSVPEVAGDAAMLARSPGERDLQEAICKVLEDDSLAASLTVRGRAHVQRFSWAETARLTSDVYHAVSGASA